MAQLTQLVGNRVRTFPESESESHSVVSGAGLPITSLVFYVSVPDFHDGASLTVGIIGLPHLHLKFMIWCIRLLGLP